MASSTKAAEPWIPGLPDNEAEVRGTMRAYQQGLELMAAQGGIPALMGELTRINAAIQQQGQTALAAALTQRLEATIGHLDTVVLRSRPTASPSPGSERGLVAQASRTSPPPSQLPPRSTPGGFGRAAAARIAAAAERRRADG